MPTRYTAAEMLRLRSAADGPPPGLAEGCAVANGQLRRPRKELVEVGADDSPAGEPPPLLTDDDHLDDGGADAGLRSHKAVPLVPPPPLPMPRLVPPDSPREQPGQLNPHATAFNPPPGAVPPDAEAGRMPVLLSMGVLSDSAGAATPGLPLSESVDAAAQLSLLRDSLAEQPVVQQQLAQMQSEPPSFLQSFGGHCAAPLEPPLQQLRAMLLNMQQDKAASQASPATAPFQSPAPTLPQQWLPFSQLTPSPQHSPFQPAPWAPTATATGPQWSPAKPQRLFPSTTTSPISSFYTNETPQRPRRQGRVVHGRARPEDRYMAVTDVSAAFVKDPSKPHLPPLLSEHSGDIQLPQRPQGMLEAETDEHRLRQRQKQVDFGMATQGFLNYRRAKQLGMALTGRVEPHVPNIYQKCSKRSWDGQVRLWRQHLHAFDDMSKVLWTPVELEEIESRLREDERRRQALKAESAQCAGKEDASLSPVW
eukprot:TRINITY_DN3065_c0_g1_i1.p1 TRINITY_DN3065_c0_g1~~TRINITY_DN3065_c0_g1_i1.p1  ORF type:complete len:480 (+),score=194.44 TRINITY_DN3065_c0_g1_i1:69-1508(+)